MKISEKIGNMKKDKKTVTAVMLLGTGGLLLIMISSLFSGKEEKSETLENIRGTDFTDSADYCQETERRLESFLETIEGAGNVRVYLTVGTDQRYVYAREEKHSRSENKTEEEEKYVMIGGGNGKSALIETVEVPEITGAVVACTGCDSPIVTERIYRAVSAALGISSGKIFVTKLEG
ncbi:MAG: hypothetical protein IKK47_01240 [Ruminococcus sp.]|nr:hypothetical protein [Ruminococcus sp.]